MDLICLNSARQVGCGKDRGQVLQTISLWGSGHGNWSIWGGGEHKEKWELGGSQENEERVKDYEDWKDHLV